MAAALPDERREVGPSDAPLASSAPLAVATGLAAGLAALMAFVALLVLAGAAEALRAVVAREEARRAAGCVMVSPRLGARRCLKGPRFCITST